MGMVPAKKGYPLFLGMKKDHSFSIVVIFGISLLLTLSCAYAYYDDLLEADFLSTGAKYESQDCDNFFLEKQNLASTAAKPLTAFLLWVGNFSASCLVFSLPLDVTDPISSILRC
jgi:hypothetical protein